MRRDAKLGLALGMLVIGFALAFCFPRHPAGSWQVVEPAEALNSPEFDFLPIRAYQPTVESEAAESGTGLEPSSSTGVEVPLAESRPVPEPILPLAAPKLVEILRPEGSLPEKTGGDAAAGEEGRPSPPVPRTYRVRPGDTLTSIAFRLFGSSQRYREIYEANRDLLASPDDLKVNLELRIPGPDRIPQRAESKPVPEAESLAKQKQEDGESEERPVPKRFQRANQVPFLSERPPELPLNAIRIPVQESHVVQPGETLEGIARRYFGDPRGVSFLQAANPHVEDPKRLKPGTELQLR